ncbi:MAG: hypothetical protein RKH07_11225 [Gammaproteobacteria bacterium]
MKPLLRYIMLLSLLLGWSVQAAEDPAPQSQDTEEIQAEQDAPAANDSEDDQAVADDAEESPGRFIPTEEISQDLGVSFPIDI